MSDRGKIRPDSPSKKSQDETQQKHRSRFLEKTALSPSSEPFHDGTSPLLRQDIVEKGLDELKAYLKKKEGLESAEKVLLEAEEKVNRQEEEKCESLEQKLRENKHNIYEVESKIYELYSELNKIIKETKNLIQMGKLLGNRPLSGENRLTPRNAKEYSQKWDNLQPITHHQTSESLDLRDQEYVKASQTLLDRLAEVPEGSSQSIFWMRYSEIINRTIDVYKNPQPEEAKERLMKALETLDKANKIANAFLDLIYGKEQEASSSQEQA